MSQQPNTDLVLEYEDYNLLLEALEHYEQDVLPEQKLKGLMGGVMASLIETRGNQAKAEAAAERLLKELGQKQKAKKETAVLLRAKLIKLKDRSLVESLSDQEEATGD